MGKSQPGFLQPVQITGKDSNNTEDTALGPTVVVDLADASAARVTSVSKILTNDKVFDDKIDFFLSFQYKGEILPGNLSGLKISLTQKRKNLIGEEKLLAKGEVTSAIPTGTPTRLEMFSPDSKLRLATVECSG